MASSPNYQRTEEDWLEDERVWLSRSDLKRMIYSLARVNDFGIAPISSRKWRLFAVACVRRVAFLFNDERTHGLIQAIEDVADGLLDHQAYRRLEIAVCDPPLQDWVSDDDNSSPLANALSSLGWACDEQVEAYESYWTAVAAQLAIGQPDVEAQAQSGLLHELFDNPFKPKTLALAPSSPIIIGLARAAYEERRFPRGELDGDCLSVLADALEDAGCIDARCLGLLRTPGPHVRGCWVVDLILARK